MVGDWSLEAGVRPSAVAGWFACVVMGKFQRLQKSSVALPGDGHTPVGNGLPRLAEVDMLRGSWVLHQTVLEGW